jgi:tRNA pseudouridine38-40 synthase
MNMYRYFLELSYKGTQYHGWQSQRNATAIQPILAEALATVLRETVELTGAGRTDTGVHARYYVAHFDCSKENLHKDPSFLKAANSLLPFDIAVSNIILVNSKANARFDATWREYEYHIVFQKDPFLQEYAWHLKVKPDINAMNRAASLLLKQNDFASFCKAHSNNKTTLCKVMHAEWKETGNKLVFTIRADRFLRNMVRAIVGTLLDVGYGKVSYEAFKAIIALKNRCNAGTSVPAHGLFLTGIGYPEEVFLNR